jgi:hypothetical protein
MKEIRAADLFIHPIHSLGNQSFADPVLPLLQEGLYYDKSKLKMRNHDVNLDGWGLGWYSRPEVIGAPRSVQRERSANGATQLDGETGEHKIDPALEELCEQVHSCGDGWRKEQPERTPV